MPSRSRTHRHWTIFSASFRTRYLRVILSILVVAARANLVQAQDTHDWSDPSGGIYGLFNNWQPAQIPASQDTARFALDAIYDVRIVQNRIANELHVLDGEVSLQGSGLTGPAPTYTVETTTIEDSVLNLMPDSRAIHLAVNDQLTVTDALINVAAGANLTTMHAELDGENASSDLIVSGQDALGNASAWNTSSVVLANVGLANLTVEGGAAASSGTTDVGEGASGTGVVRVFGQGADGTPSTLDAGKLTLGSEGRGELFVEAGAKLLTDSQTILGRSGGTAVANIAGVASDGTPSTWVSTDILVVGGSGDADLNVTGGAMLASQNVDLAFGANADVLVSGGDANGNPSTWTMQNLITAPFAGGSGSLRFEDGAQVTSENVILQQSQAFLVGTGQPTPQTTWSVADQLSVGSGSPGDIFIENGARLATATVEVGAAGGNGSISFMSNGIVRSTWTNSGDVFVGGNAQGSLGQGTIAINDSDVDIAGTLTIFDDGTVEVIQSVLVADRIDNSHGGSFSFASSEIQFNRFDGDLVNQTGIVAPGINSVVSTVTGDYVQQADGSLRLSVDGPGSHDMFSVSGVADLDGLLEIDLNTGFLPDPVDTFSVLAADNLIGFFDNVLSGDRLHTLDGAGSFIVNYGVASPFDSDHIVLSDFMIESILSGDFDGSGLVGAGDLDLVLGAWGDDVSMTGVPSGWINEIPTGLIGAAQLDLVLSNWGASASASLSAVPEPSSALLLVWGIMGLVRCRLSLPRK